jgi:hypothetical protein
MEAVVRRGRRHPCRALVDTIAEAAERVTGSFPRVVELYRDAPEIQVGRTVRSYTIDGPKTVRLGAP